MVAHILHNEINMKRFQSRYILVKDLNYKLHRVDILHNYCCNHHTYILYIKFYFLLVKSCA